MAIENTPGWIGVDLDGTLAHYDTWRGMNHIGAPVRKMVNRVEDWLKRGFEVRIFTARACEPDQMIRTVTINTIQNWLEHQANLPRLAVTCVKDFHMIELWDDRAVQVIMNTGDAILRRLDS
jgi:hypothetical protein